jgi:hypothetical protein
MRAAMTQNAGTDELSKAVHFVGGGDLKSRVISAEDEMDFVGGAIALFGDDQFCLGAFFGGFVGFECAGTVNEHHHVGVLLDGARFAQIGRVAGGGRRVRERGSTG